MKKKDIVKVIFGLIILVLLASLGACNRGFYGKESWKASVSTKPLNIKPPKQPHKYKGNGSYIN